MNRIFLQYPKCTTCKKAKKFLEVNNVTFEDRHIVENNPTEEELKEWIERSGLEIKKFFNTSGLKYKELELKDKLASMSDDEKIKLRYFYQDVIDYFDEDRLLIIKSGYEECKAPI